MKDGVYFLTGFFLLPVVELVGGGARCSRGTWEGLMRRTHMGGLETGFDFDLGTPALASADGTR